LFAVSVETTFRASHRTILPNGLEEQEHRHIWFVKAAVASDKLDDVGFVIDFDRLKALLDKVVGRFDNGSLGKVSYFKRSGSSAETVAKYIYEKLEACLPKGVWLEFVEVAEQPGYSARFYKPP
jgi:6-pyruvoyl-tetrahydropterin synthase